MGANAQTSVPTFTAGEILTAANMNISARTGVPVFADTAARDAAFGGTGEKTLAEGQTCYVETAPDNLQIYDGVTWVSFQVGSWVSYTPTWSSSGTQPAIGDGTLSGRWNQTGKLVVAQLFLGMGSTTTYGTGVYRLSLPTNSRSVLTSYQVVGFATIVDASASNAYLAMAEHNASDVDKISFRYQSTTGNFGDVTATSPITWATNDTLRIEIVYEAA